MARFKIKKKKSDPDWLEQCRVKKQEKYDKKHSVKKKVTPYPLVGDLWPEEFNEIVQNLNELKGNKLC